MFTFKRKNNSLSVKILEGFEDVVQPIQKASKALPDWFKKCPMDDIRPNTDKSSLSVKACIPFKEAMNVGWTMRTWAEIKVDVVMGIDCYGKGDQIIYDPYSEVHLKDPTGDKNQFVGGTLHGIEILRTEITKPKARFSFPDLWGIDDDPVHKTMDIVSYHDEWQLNSCLKGKFFVDQTYKLHSPYVFETPKGYSLLIGKHQFNYGRVLWTRIVIRLLLIFLFSGQDISLELFIFLLEPQLPS